MPHYDCHLEGVTSNGKSDSITRWYFLEVQSCQISSPSDLKRRRLRLFQRASPNNNKKINNQKKNKTSSDMGSVPDPKLVNLYFDSLLFTNLMRTKSANSRWNKNYFVTKLFVVVEKLQSAF